MSHNGNEIVSLGGETLGAFSIGGIQRHVEGFPIASIFNQRILSAEFDDVGNVTNMMCEGGDPLSGGGPAVPCDEAGTAYWGQPVPTREASVSMTFTLWRNLRLFGLVDYVGGHIRHDDDLGASHTFFNNSKAAVLRNDPLLEAIRFHDEAFAIQSGLSKGDFAKLRNVSFAFTLPADWRSSFGASRAVLTLAAENVTTLWAGLRRHVRTTTHRPRDPEQHRQWAERLEPGEAPPVHPAAHEPAGVDVTAPAIEEGTRASEPRYEAMSKKHDGPRCDRRMPRVAPVLLLAATVATGCENLLEVDLPGRVEASSLDDPALAGLLVDGAIGDFECAFASYALTSALVTDELEHTSTGLTTRLWDLRQITAANSEGAECRDEQVSFAEDLLGYYSRMQVARFQGEDALRRLEAFSDAEVAGRASLMATAAAYSGYATLLLGESMCEMALDLGPIITPAQTLEVAQASFTRAIGLAQDAGSDEILDLAYIGRARTHLGLGNTDEAAADARRVSAGFEAMATRSADRRPNPFFENNYNGTGMTVGPSFRNVAWAGVPDPRVGVEDSGRQGEAPGHRIWQANKYPSAEAPIRFASWTEAQLIIAEVEGGPTAVGIINDLHDRAGILGFSSTDPEEIATQVLEERRRELFLEGHRMNDLLRLDLDWPSGSHPVDDQQYGSTTCLPLPLVERTANPNIPE